MTLSFPDLPVTDKQYWLQHLIGPRPVGLVSTVDAEGRPNLSPFSFFNVFSMDPPILIFSPSRRVRDNTTKHTLENLLVVPELVCSIVNYPMVQQTSLASCEYAKGVDEFAKAEFTKRAALYVRPPLVAESPANFECQVKEIKPLGDRGGAGNLVICEVRCLHVQDELLADSMTIDPRRLDLVARLGDNWYARINATNLFEVEKPNRRTGIGMDRLPTAIRESSVLTGNHLAQLANVDTLPEPDSTFTDPRLEAIKTFFPPDQWSNRIHHYASTLLDEGKVASAWQALLNAGVPV